MIDKDKLMIHLMRIQACDDLLTANLRQAHRDHPEDDKIVESGLFQSSYSFGHLSYELNLLYEALGTSERQLRHDFAESLEDLRMAPGEGENWDIQRIRETDNE